MPARQLGLVPQVVQQAAQREFGAGGRNAVGLSTSGRNRRPAWHLGQPEVQPERRLAGGRVLSDRAAQHLPQARELGGRFVGRAVGRVMAARVGHALDDVAIAQARHVHFDAFNQAHAARALVGRMGLGDGVREASRADLEAPARDLVDRSRCRDALSRSLHERGLIARVPARRGRASAASRA